MLRSFMFWLLLSVTTTLSLTFGYDATSETLHGAPLFLEVGEQRILTFPKINRFSVSSSKIMHYVRIAGQNAILIKALKPGLATLFVSTAKNASETHSIRIEAKKNSPYPHALLQALNLIQTTEVIDGGDRYLLRGQIHSLTEAHAVANLKERFPTFILDETTRSPTELARTARNLKKILASHPGVVLEASEGTLVVRGGISTSTLKDSITRQIHTIDPLVLVELQTVKDTDPTLYFKVFLLEVKKELITQLGMEWPPTRPATLNLSGQFLAGDSIDLTIHALTQKGLVRVLSSPELVVKAPGQAELFAGGEIPIRQHTKNSDSVTWKNIGLSLKLDVKEYGGERVRLTIETEMSHRDESLGNDQIPGIQTNRIKTLVDGTLGKPLLLSGLLQEDLRSTTKGIPGLSAIPVLGSLFSSEDYQNSRSEFVAILLPERNLPSHPMERISSDYPRGYLPVPRNHLSLEDKDQVKQSANYPWNVL